MHKLFLFAFIIVFGGATLGVQAQTPATSPTPAGMPESGIRPNLALGEVTAVSSTDNKISLKTNDGAIEAILSAATTYKRVPPENPKLSAATPAALTDIGVGDKVLITGAVSADKKSLPAKAVYLMTKADIAKKITSETEAWKTRGISGRIVSLNPNTEEFTIAVRGMMGEQNVVVKQKDGISYRRYAPNSVKFDDAKTSSFAELKVGDQVKALGDKSADNTSFQAEKVISGAFKMVGGTITAIDTAKNEITIKELATNKPITIVLNSNSLLKKFPEEMANMMAMRQMGGAAGAGAQPPQGAGQGNVVVMRPPQQTGAQPTTGERPTSMQQGGGGMRGGRGEFDDLLERFPTISIADLKVGDAIGVSSTASSDASHVTAIKLVSGVEPFFKASQMAGAAGMQRGNQGGGGQGGFNIPGLDGGIGTP